MATDPELLLIDAIKKAAPGLDEQTRRRILTWAAQYFGLAQPTGPLSGGTLLSEGTSPPTVLQDAGGMVSNGEIPGIAMLDKKGEIKLTFRDVKAKTKTEAAVRLALLAIYVHGELTGQPEMSRSKVLNPLLTDRRAFDGRVRQAIADEKGIVKTGDLLTLDHHAKEEAQRIIREILDPNVPGGWSPGGRKKRVKSRSPEETK